MRSFILFIALSFASATAQAQDVTGTWYGTLQIQASKLHMVLHINKEGDHFTGTMDSPDQNAAGLKADTVTFDGSTLTVETKVPAIKYMAKYDAGSNEFAGNFHQGSFDLPMILKRTKDETKADTKQAMRPQDPKDYPYYQEDVTIKNTKDNVTLAGTLTLPKDKKAKSIVVLITGSGPQNRNEEIKQFNHRPFLVWSDWLTRHGIGVLRYDDRGVGGSTGSFRTATSADFANDAEAAVSFISSRADLNKMQIGLLGHSEGGMIAPMVAARNSKVKFIVLLAGPGTSLDKLLFKQAEYGQTTSGAPKEIVELNLQSAKDAYAFLKQHKDEPREKIELPLKHLLLDHMAKYPAEAMQGGPSVDTIVNSEVASYLAPWFRYFICYEPALTLEKVKCPVLAINGTLDRQVDAQQNLPAIKAALTKGKNKSFEIVPLEGLNHLLQKATTGDVSEYPQIEETVNPAALNKVTEWINKR